MNDWLAASAGGGGKKCVKFYSSISRVQGSLQKSTAKHAQLNPVGIAKLAHLEKPNQLNLLQKFKAAACDAKPQSTY